MGCWVGADPGGKDSFRLPELAQFSMNQTLESVRVSDSQEKYSTHGATLVFLY